MIIYWILESEKQVEMISNKTILNSNTSERDDFYGCKLIGFIPCSDIFGVDLILEKYTQALAEQKERRK